MQEVSINFPWVIIVTTLIIFIFTVGFFLFLIKFQSRNHKYKNEKAELASQYQKELLRTQLEIQEQTFKTISQEIHDNIGQVLSLAKLNLFTADINDKEAALSKLNDAKDLVSRAINELRDISKTLHTDMIAELGLVKSLENELSLIQKAGVINTHIKISGTIERIEPQKELILFRIIQEALHNIIKHSNASNIFTEITYNDSSLELMIKDDGKGFVINDHYTGSGLRNMRNRAKLIGANFTINSKPGIGTDMTVSILTTK
jgi:two-component system, NarL family, sensor kinase